MATGPCHQPQGRPHSTWPPMVCGRQVSLTYSCYQGTHVCSPQAWSPKPLTASCWLNPVAPPQPGARVSVCAKLSKLQSASSTGSRAVTLGGGLKVSMVPELTVPDTGPQQRKDTARCSVRRQPAFVR